jgi:hypothetical protein
VNRIASIGTIVVMSAVISGNLVAQQTSSASQVVTFGVARARQMLVNSIAFVSNNPTNAAGLVSKIFRPRLATIPLKVTFSSKNSAGFKVTDTESLSSGQSTSRAASFSARKTPTESGSIQKDLRIFMLDNESASFGTTAMVLTITQ